MSLKLQKNDKLFEDKIYETLKEGNIAIFPCDTIYGIHGIVPHCDSKIREIKGRNETKPFIQLYSKELLETLKIDKLLLSYWPNPFTAIINKNGTNVAIRVPKDPVINNIINKLEMPIYSSSVNKSGEPFLTDSTSIINEYDNLVELIVLDNVNKNAKPSTIIDATVYPYELVRQGSFDASNLIAESAELFQ